MSPFGPVRAGAPYTARRKRDIRASKKSITFFCHQFANPYFCRGEMAEWSNAAVLKTVDCNRSGGSNPSLSAKQKERCFQRSFCCRYTAVLDTAYWDGQQNSPCADLLKHVLYNGNWKTPQIIQAGLRNPGSDKIFLNRMVISYAGLSVVPVLFFIIYHPE